MTSSATVPPSGQRTFLGHPVGLYVLFFTEMWERFSYYGMRALLMLYMINYFRWTQKDASTIYKVYTSFVYVTPIIGGYLADRYLGNKRAVIIGAILMAIGHFLMAFEAYSIFMSALVFLILGNGFFKPNMSTQVGRLYPANDGRRDGAYTIFYMGINLGAFLAPLVCGWLAENTVGGYHSGFTMAGIGMVAGLLIYLLGQPAVREIDPATPPVRPVTAAVPAATAMTEAEAARTSSVLGSLSNLMPGALAATGVLMALAGIVFVGLEIVNRQGTKVPVPMELWNSVMLTIAGGCLVLVGYVCKEVSGGLRDRVLAIMVLGIFVIFFWGAFEQAGNVLNIWADKNTDRYLTRPALPPDIVPKIVEEAPKTEATERPAAGGFLERFTTMFRLKPKTGDSESWSEWLTSSLNPVPTAWFQSINALAIFVLAPFFAWMWITLDRRGWQPSIPMKMTLGLLMMSASMAVMMAAAQQENRSTSVRLQAANMPATLNVTEGGQIHGKKEAGPPEPFHAGRLTFDTATRTLHLQGVLPDTEADRLIEETAPPTFRAHVETLQKESKAIGDKDVASVSVQLGEEPPGFDMKYSGLKRSVVTYDPATRTLTAFQPLADKEVKALLVAGGEPGFRATIHELLVESSKIRVSSWWLFWSYILATLGELCLSPVGLSMVSKLAPAKFATMLMGVWMLTSSFGNFAAGALGEVWGTIPPVQFFLIATLVVGGAALVLFVLVRKVVAMMHGVN